MSTNKQPQLRDYPLSTVPGYYGSHPGIQIGTKLSATASEEDVQFVKQLGIKWVMTGVNDPDGHTADNYRAVRERIEGVRQCVVTKDATPKSLAREISAVIRAGQRSDGRKRMEALSLDVVAARLRAVYDTVLQNVNPTTPRRRPRLF